MWVHTRTGTRSLTRNSPCLRCTCALAALASGLLPTQDVWTFDALCSDICRIKLDHLALLVRSPASVSATEDLPSQAAS